MNILILGGTGAMGIHLSQILANQGHQLFITSRGVHQDSSQTKYLRGNAHDPKFLDEVLCKEPWDAIVDFMVYSTEEFDQRYHKLLEHTSHYLFLSSSRVYADSKGEKIHENSPRLLDVTNDQEYLQTDEYALAKARQENLLFESPRSNWTIIRPYITYSENRLQLGTLEKELWLKRILRGNSIVICEEMLHKHTTLTYGYDVARGIAQLIGNEKAKGEHYHITQGDSITWGEVLEIYRESLIKSSISNPKVVKVDLPTFHHIQYNAKYQINYDRMFDRCFDTSKIDQIIDTQSFTKPTEGLRDCLTHLFKHPKFGHEDYIMSVRMDKAAHDFRPLSEFPDIVTKAKYLIRRFII